MPEYHDFVVADSALGQHPERVQETLLFLKQGNLQDLRPVKPQDILHLDRNSPGFTRGY